MFNIVVHLAEGSVTYGFRVLGAGYSNWICHLVPLLLGCSKHVTPDSLPFSKVRESESKTKQ